MQKSFYVEPGTHEENLVFITLKQIKIGFSIVPIMSLGDPITMTDYGQTKRIVVDEAHELSFGVSPEMLKEIIAAAEKLLSDPKYFPPKNEN